MDKRSICLAITVLSVLSGCNPGPNMQDAPYDRGIQSQSTDPFFSINYPESAQETSARQQSSQDTQDTFFSDSGFKTTENLFQKEEPKRQSKKQKQAPVSNVPSQFSTSTVPMTSAASNDDSEEFVTAGDAGPFHVSLLYPSPEYSIIKLDKIIPREVNINQPFKYSVIISNLTNATLTDIALTETIASTFKLNNTTPPCQQMANQLSWKFNSLGPKASERIEITGTPLSMESLKHNTTVTYALLASSNIQVVQPSIELTRKVPKEGLICDSIPIEYIVQNTGSGSARDVKITEQLPPGLTTIDGKTQLQFEIGTLRSGQSRSITAELRASRTGVYVNKAAVVSSSGIGAESAATVTSVRQPDLTIMKTCPERQYLGRPLSYEIMIMNRGDGPAYDTTLVDVIPSGVTAVEASAGADINSGKLTWQLGQIPANSSKTVKVSYKPNSTGVLTSTATVSAHCAKTITAEAKTAVVGIPAIRLDVIDLEDPIELGGTVTYLITVSNEGSAADSNILIVCHLEDTLQYISSSGSTQATLMGRTISFSPLRSLAPTEKATWRIVSKAVRPGGVRFKVTLSSSTLERPIEETEATFLYQ